MRRTCGRRDNGMSLRYVLSLRPPGLEIPLHYVCGMGRHPRGTEPNGRRQIAFHLCTHVAPPIPIFPSARAPHSASLRSKRSGIPVIQKCKPSFVLSAARVGVSAALRLRNGATPSRRSLMYPKTERGSLYI